MTPVALVLLSYLLGSIPTSYWIGHVFFRLDLREKGSGNLGANNALRVYGWRGSVPVLIVDIGKGYIPVAVLPTLEPALSLHWTLVLGGAAILGHVFSMWVGFRGGKGVATSAGVLLGLAPVALGAAFIVWLTALALSRIVSMASLSGAISLPVFVWLLRNGRAGDGALLWFACGLAVFVVWAHRSNIRRILRGKEPTLGRRTKPGAGYR